MARLYRMIVQTVYYVEPLPLQLRRSPELSAPITSRSYLPPTGVGPRATHASTRTPGTRRRCMPPKASEGIETSLCAHIVTRVVLSGCRFVVCSNNTFIALACRRRPSAPPQRTLPDRLPAHSTLRSTPPSVVAAKRSEQPCQTLSTPTPPIQPTS